jgi:hypothetical protein
VKARLFKLTKHTTEIHPSREGLPQRSPTQS